MEKTMNFALYNIESAPEDSKALLEKSLKGFGMIPNLHAVLAESPATLEAYQELGRLFQQSSFDKDELTVVWQTINIENECHYCVPAHTAIAHSMKIDTAIIDALNNRTELPTKKLQILHETTLALIKNHGRLTDKQISNFTSVGYSQKNILEIILGLSQKIISNYTNHLSNTPVDEPFQKFIK